MLQFLSTSVTILREGWPSLACQVVRSISDTVLLHLATRLQVLFADSTLAGILMLSKTYSPCLSFPSTRNC